MTPNQAMRALLRDYLLWLKEQEAEKQRIESQMKAHWISAPK